MVLARASVEVDPRGIYDLIAGLHKTFARNILESAKRYTPVETGDLQESWDTAQEGVNITHVYLPNTNEGAAWDLPGVGKVDWLLRGTGVYGPLGRPYTSKHIKPITDPYAPIRLKPMVWYSRGGQLMIRHSVKGINPRYINGIDGAYDFGLNLSIAVREGVSDAAQEWNE